MKFNIMPNCNYILRYISRKRIPFILCAIHTRDINLSYLLIMVRFSCGQNATLNVHYMRVYFYIIQLDPSVHDITSAIHYREINTVSYSIIGIIYYIY